MKVEIQGKKNFPRGELKLGTCRVGQKVTKKIPIINRSAATATFQVHCAAQTSIQEVLTISPSSQIVLKSKETCDIEITFQPKTRIPPFRIVLNLLKI